MHYSAPLLSEILILGLICLFDAVFDQHKFFNSKIFRKRVSVTSCHRSLQKYGVQILKDQENDRGRVSQIFLKRIFRRRKCQKKSQKHRFALKVAELPEGPPWAISSRRVLSHHGHTGRTQLPVLGEFKPVDPEAPATEQPEQDSTI